MISLRLVLDATAAFPELASMQQRRHTEMALTCLEGGMKSGNPSVAVILKFPDNTFAFAETSLKAFLVAADAFKAKYGDPRKEAVPE